MTAEFVEEGPRPLHRRRRTRWIVAGVAVLAVLGVGTGVVLTRQSTRPAAAAQGPTAVDTVEVATEDLTERQGFTGKLGYGSEHTLTGRRPGTITALPAQGTVLERGQSVYQVDAKPVPLFYAGIPLYRDVGSGVTDGPDVQVVEENLQALGFTGFGTPNEKFGTATANAIKKWQKSLGLEQTGVVAMGDVVITTGPVRVATVSVELGASGTGGVLTYTSTDRAVTVDLEASQKNMAKPGDKVALTIAGAPATGTVAAVAPKPDDGGDQGTNPFDQGDQEQQFTVTITLDDPAAAGGLDAGSVDVRFTTGTREGVLAVPVGALLALAEGGYAVEVVEGAERRLVAVETGLFADGKVEVSGSGLQAGMQVVVTS